MRRVLVFILTLASATMGCSSESSFHTPFGGDTHPDDDGWPPDDADDDPQAACQPLTTQQGCAFFVPASCPTIQEAIDAAVDGETVCVTPGLYEETLEIAHKDIAVVGVGGSRVTTIDAGHRGSVVRILSASAPQAALRGFTLTGGSAEHGGGLYLEDADPSLFDLRVTDCHATDSGGGLYGSAASPIVASTEIIGNDSDTGGGLYLTRSEAWLTDVLVELNEARHGGGIALFESSPLLTDVALRHNASDDDGGALWASQSAPSLSRVEITGSSTGDVGTAYFDESPGVLTDIVISGNTAEHGAGIGIRNDVGPTLRGVSITTNVAARHGGGVYIDDADVFLADVRIEGNTAHEGAGVYVAAFTGDSDAILADVRIVENTATEGGGGVYVESSASVLLANTLLVGNDALEGGGLMLDESARAEVVNTVVAANTVSRVGGGVRLRTEAALSATNSIFWANSADRGGAVHGDNAHVTLSHCNAWSNTPEDYYAMYEPTGWYGNLSVEPGFLDTTSSSSADWDLHLDASSPLVDTGSPILTDPDGSRSDIGAYGGPGAVALDLANDGYPAWWFPGPYDAATYSDDGWDCDDLDPEVHPGAGC